MNLDVWNKPPQCEKCKSKHWGACEKTKYDIHARRGDNGNRVTVVKADEPEPRAKPDWGVSRENARKNETHVPEE